MECFVSYVALGRGSVSHLFRVCLAITKVIVKTHYSVVQMGSPVLVFVFVSGLHQTARCKQGAIC